MLIALGLIFIAMWIVILVGLICALLADYGEFCSCRQYVLDREDRPIIDERHHHSTERCQPLDELIP